MLRRGHRAIVYDAKMEFPCRWDARDGTLYSGYASTVFRDRRTAHRVVAKAVKWWAKFREEHGFAPDDDSERYVIISLLEGKR